MPTVEEKDVDIFKDYIKTIGSDIGLNVAAQREDNENIRFCKWNGQSPDGKKRKNYLGKPAKPFEGASDSRIRTADFTIKLQTAILTQAATRATARVKGMEANDDQLAGKMGTLLKWIFRNQIADQLRREIKKVIQFAKGDSPAVAFMGVFWEQKIELVGRSLTMEGLLEIFVDAMGVFDQDQILMLEKIFTDPKKEVVAAQLFAVVIADMENEEILRVLKDLREKGEANFEHEHIKVNVPKLCAKRLYEDIFGPQDVSDPQESSYWFDREWLYADEVKARIVSHDYDKDFVKALLGDKEGGNGEGYKGQTAFPERTRQDAGEIQLSDNTQTTPQDKYEIINAYYKKVNDDNIMGLYFLPFNQDAGPAKDRELLDYDHGKYPFVAFSHETLNHRLFDSRGIPDLAQSAQWSQKLLNDSFEDHCQLSTVPPIKQRGGRQRTQLVLAPMARVEEKRPNEVEWMKPPEYPRTNMEHQRNVERRHDRYFGIPNPDVPTVISDILTQDMVDDFLTFFKEVSIMTLQLCQQYMTDEQISRVVGGNGVAIARTRDELQGQFDLELSFDPRDLDMEYLKIKGEFFANTLKAMDSKAVVKWDRVVSYFAGAMDPTLAEDVIEPIEIATRREIEDEELNWCRIMAGIEPVMVDSGQNFSLRLETLQNIVRENPATVAKLTPDSRAILDRRIEHLQFMVQQQQNAQIGRVGVSPALPLGDTGVDVGV